MNRTCNILSALYAFQEVTVYYITTIVFIKNVFPLVLESNKREKNNYDNVFTINFYVYSVCNVP